MLLDGRAVAQALRDRTAPVAQALAEAGHQPRLAVVVPVSDDATQWYVDNLAKIGAKMGVAVDVHEPRGAAAVSESLRALAADPAVHGIICQKPFPEGLSPAEVGRLVPPAKDVDGLGAASLGELVLNGEGFAPATAAAVMVLLREAGVPILGAEACVIGQSAVVGRPTALLLLREHATVTVTHTETRDLAEHTRRADILVSATGVPGLVTAAHVKPGATVIDVGTTMTEKGFMGDVDTADVERVAGLVTPVPGGVGTVTTTVLLAHVVQAAQAVADAAATSER